MIDKMSEVEAAKKAVWASDVELLDPDMLPAPDRLLTEAEHAHNESLPLPVSAPPVKDSPTCKVCSHELHEGACKDYQCLCTQYPSIRGIKVTAYPVGELEGAFEAWDVRNYICSSDPLEVEAIRMERKKAWVAAISYKPAPEGIPEVPKDRLEAIAADDFCEFDECTTHEPKIGVCVACDAIYAARECLNLRAIISAKDAENKKLRFDLAVAHASAVLGSQNYKRVEAAEAELASLKLSSAKVREEGKAEGLREAADAVSDEGAEVGLYSSFIHYSQGIEAAHRSILSLLPTSPESQEGK